VAANYNATAISPGYTYGQPLEYAEGIRSQYIADIGQTTTPIITSGWRNPERNERVGGALNSNHQRGAAVDLVPGNNLPSNLFPRIYTANDPDGAATTWCELASSAFDVGNARETLVENTRGRPSNVNANYYRTLTSRIYYRYHLAQNQNISKCVTEVTSAIEVCRNNQLQLNVQNPDKNNLADENLVCSPNHMHTAR